MNLLLQVNNNFNILFEITTTLCALVNLDNFSIKNLSFLVNVASYLKFYLDIYFFYRKS